MRGIRPTWWVLAVLLLPLSVAICGERDDKEAREYIRKALEQQNVDFVIKGRVVDQDGTLLNGVTAVVEKSKATGMFREEDTKTTEVVNGTFCFTVRTAYAVNLEFRLTGHHGSGLLDYGSSVPAEGVRIEGRTHFYDDVTVVLQKIGKLAHLHEYLAPVLWQPDGALVAWDISRIGRERTATKCVKLTANPGPEIPCVYLHIVKSETPMPAVVHDSAEISPRDGVVQLVIQDGKGGGFIRVPSQGKDQRQMLLQMTTAPADGYTARLDLTPQEVAGFRTTTPVYYYAKVNGMFGKGYICNMFYSSAVGIRDSALNFWLQPDGSTNVETTSW